MLIKLKQKIEKRINTSRRRSFGLYNNIVAGIITGTITGSIISQLFKYPWNPRVYLSMAFISVIFVFIFYKIGRWAVRLVPHDHSEDKNYFNNFVAGIFVGIYTSLFILVGGFWRAVLICISIIVLVILLYVFAKRKSSFITNL